MIKDLYTEWDFDKNGSIEGYKSAERVWWICKNNHSWEASINNRKSKHSGCPYCSGKKPSKENNLLVKHPILCEEWDYDKNKLDPNQYTSGSCKKTWWKCNKGHSWDASPNTRTNGHGCPYCNSKKTLLEDSLLYKYPELCKELNQEKNNFDPSKHRPFTNKNLWWICKNNHTWKARTATRIAGHGCPYCDGQKATEENNLSVLFPDICKHWDYDKNDSPKNYLPSSVKKVWWKCDKGHSYKLKIRVFVKRTNKCLICENKVVHSKYNLLFNYPDLCKEWDYDKNLDPSLYLPQSHKKVWWKCKKGHSWEANIKNRVNGTGCSMCNNKSVSISCIEWLNELKIPNKNREIRVGKYIVDALYEGIVYEYLGDFWHGNPSIYAPNDINRVSKEKYGDLLLHTIHRLNKISKKHKIIYRWESGDKNNIYNPILLSEQTIINKAMMVENDILKEL